MHARAQGKHVGRPSWSATETYRRWLISVREAGKIIAARRDGINAELGIRGDGRRW